MYYDVNVNKLSDGITIRCKSKQKRQILSWNKKYYLKTKLKVSIFIFILFWQSKAEIDLIVINNSNVSCLTFCFTKIAIWWRKVKRFLLIPLRNTAWEVWGGRSGGGETNEVLTLLTLSCGSRNKTFSYLHFVWWTCN